MRAIFLFSKKRMEDEETDGILHGIVPLIAACSYFAMATQQGATPLPLGAEEATPGRRKLVASSEDGRKAQIRAEAALGSTSRWHRRPLRAP